MPRRKKFTACDFTLLDRYIGLLKCRNKKIR